LIAACPDVPQDCGADFQVTATARDVPDRIQLNVVVKRSPTRTRVREILDQIARAHPRASLVAFVFDDSIGPERYGLGVEINWQGTDRLPVVAIPAEEASWVATSSVVPRLEPRLFWGPAAPGS